MKSCRRPLLALATMTLAALAAPATADVKAGVDAWQAGNYAAAVKEWRPLADRGDADAQFNMAQAYRFGRGALPDMRIAQSWYEKAAQQGHEEAQVNLGLILYQNGDRTASLPWIKKASDRGDPRAQYVLGTALFNGDLAGKDWPRAYALMTRAAASGLPPAASSLAEMDRYIPLPEREKGLALARVMERNAANATLAATAPAGPVGASRASGAVAATPPAIAATPKPAPLPSASAAVTEAPSSPAPAPAKPVAVAAKSPAPAKPVVTAAKTPSPAPRAVAPVKPAVAAGGRWRAQFGAFADPANANRQWAVLGKRVGALNGLQPLMTRAGAVTRLQAGPFASRGEAEKLCAAARAAGQACIAVAQ